jgi:hypothetical protein
VFYNNDFEEALWVEVSCGSSCITVGAFYRSPNGTEENNQALNTLIKDVSMTCDRLVLIGDFNYPEVEWELFQSSRGPNHGTSKFVDTCADSMLEQLVVEPTRYREGQNSTRDDLILTNIPDIVSAIEHTPNLGLSDHQVLDIELNVKVESGKQGPIKFRYQNGNYQAMRDMISVDEVVDDMQNKNVQESWALLKGILKEACDLHIPKSGCGTKFFRKKPLWMNDKALAAVKKKHQSYRRYLQTKDGADYQEYKKERDNTTKTIKQAVRDFEKKIAKESKSNPKGFWAYYKSKTLSKPGIPSLRNPQGGKCETDQSKAEVLNNFFTSVYKQEKTGNLPEFEERIFNDDLRFFVITNEEVLKKLSQLDQGKSSGPDKIHPKVLWELREEIAPLLTVLFNKSLNAGELPKDWKLAKVVPIFKKGDKKEANNYRLSKVGM